MNALLPRWLAASSSSSRRAARCVFTISASAASTAPRYGPASAAGDSDARAATRLSAARRRARRNTFATAVARASTASSLRQEASGAIQRQTCGAQAADKHALHLCLRRRWLVAASSLSNRRAARCAFAISASAVSTAAQYGPATALVNFGAQAARRLRAARSARGNAIATAVARGVARGGAMRLAGVSIGSALPKEAGGEIQRQTCDQRYRERVRKRQL